MERNNENKVYVGNLSYDVDTDELREIFESCGTVKYAKVIFDRETQKSKGFGFVQFENSSAFEAALQKTDEEFKGRRLFVKTAN